MKNEEILQTLIKGKTLDKSKLQLIKKSLLKSIKQYDDMEYIDQRFFQETLDAAIKLIFIRLRDNQDPRPCKNLYSLVGKSIDIAKYELPDWILKNYPADPEYINNIGTESQIELAKIYLYTKVIKNNSNTKNLGV